MSYYNTIQKSRKNPQNEPFIMMLRQLFTKKTYEPVDKELEQVYKELNIPLSKLKIRKQAATYFNPYSYIVEGELDNRRFVLSLHSSELKEEINKQQLEFIIQCENPNWVVLELYPKKLGHTTKKLGAESIDLTACQGLENLVMECSNKELAQKILSRTTCKKIAQVTKQEAPSIKIERKRLHYKTNWLPDNSTKSQVLLNAIQLGIFLVAQIDKAV